MSLSFEQKLKNYADLIVQVGANVQAGQNVMFRAPVEGPELARLIVESAYAAGARFVDVLWSDEQTMLSTFKHAPDEVLNEMPAWQRSALVDAAARHDAFIEIRAVDPELLKEIEPARVAAYQTTRRRELRPFSEAVMNSDVNWCLVTMPVESWAGRLYPEDGSDEAMVKLWDAIFKAVRADADDPVAAWREHLAGLERRREHLNKKQYSALKYTAPGTDLTVDLPEGHMWLGGYQPTNDGITYVANMPTEEVFTCPHRDRVDGTVKSTKPLAYAGKVISGFEFTFRMAKWSTTAPSKGRTF